MWVIYPSNQQQNPYSNTYNLVGEIIPIFLGIITLDQTCHTSVMYHLVFNRTKGNIEMVKKSITEDCLLKYIHNSDVLIHNQSASMRAFEMQLCQLTSAINNGPSGSLPSETECN